jgi:hypothetical protein
MPTVTLAPPPAPLKRPVGRPPNARRLLGATDTASSASAPRGPPRVMSAEEASVSRSDAMRRGRLPSFEGRAWDVFLQLAAEALGNAHLHVHVPVGPEAGQPWRPPQYRNNFACMWQLELLHSVNEAVNGRRGDIISAPSPALSATVRLVNASPVLFRGRAAPPSPDHGGAAAAIAVVATSTPSPVQSSDGRSTLWHLALSWQGRAGSALPTGGDAWVVRITAGPSMDQVRQLHCACGRT